MVAIILITSIGFLAPAGSAAISSSSYLANQPQKLISADKSPQMVELTGAIRAHYVKQDIVINLPPSQILAQHKVSYSGSAKNHCYDLLKRFVQAAV